MYLLRWKLVYKSGKVKVGRWGKQADKGDTSNEAWRQDSAGLSVAMIERKNLTNQVVDIAAEVDGHDFCRFSWIGTLRIRQAIAGARPNIVGLNIETRSAVLSCLNDGSVSSEARVLPETKFHYGRGRSGK